MKLLVCAKCSEVFSLSHEYKECKGGHAGGRYVDNLNAHYWGPRETTFILGFANGSFVDALRGQLMHGDLPPTELGGYGFTSPGREFKAFIIPYSASSVHRSTKDLTQKQPV